MDCVMGKNRSRGSFGPHDTVSIHHYAECVFFEEWVQGATQLCSGGQGLAGSALTFSPVDSFPHRSLARLPRAIKGDESKRANQTAQGGIFCIEHYPRALQAGSDWSWAVGVGMRSVVATLERSH